MLFSLFADFVETVLEDGKHKRFLEKVQVHIKKRQFYVFKNFISLNSMKL